MTSKSDNLTSGQYKSKILQTEISKVFSEECYQPFVETLQNNGINQISQLHGISIYALLNQYNISLGRDHYTLLSKIEKKLESMFSTVEQIKESAVAYVIQGEEFESVIDSNQIKVEITSDEEYSSIKYAGLMTVVSKYLKSKGLQPVKVEDIKVHLGLGRRSIVGGLISAVSWAIEIEDSLFVHRDNILEIDIVAEILLKALHKLFNKNSGYASKRQLFDSVRTDLDLFMFETGFDSEDQIYFLAKHLFEKEKYKRNNYIFFNNFHIWEKEPDYPKNLTGILIKFARENNGIVSKEMCENYLKYIGVVNVNVPAVMRLWQESFFWQIDSEKYILSEMIGINDQFEQSLKSSLNLLFSECQFVIIREIANHWYITLPSLPRNLRWTPLLLQEAIRNLKTGYRTIPAGFGQSMDTIHAAITREDSGFKTFADIVWDYVNRLMGTPIHMETEKLRRILVEAGMLRRNERLFTMHKALEDYRFIWVDENRTVNITKG
jgi:hypothetical protein